MEANRLKVVSTIWFALIGGQVIFLVFAFATSGQFLNKGLINFLEYIAVFVNLSTFLMSKVVYKMMVGNIKHSNPSEHIAKYVSAMIVKGALMESGNLFCIAAIMLTGATWLAIPVVLVLGMMFLDRPTVERYQRETDNPSPLEDSK